MNVRTDHRRTPRSNGGIARRAPVRALGLTLAVLLLATLLAPLGGVPAAAAAEDAPVPTEAAAPAVQDDGGDGGEVPADEIPVPEETPVVETPIVETPVVETPVVAETPDPTLDPAQEDPGTSGIFVAMKQCPSLYGGDIQQLNANCQPAADIPFDVYGGGVLWESAQGTFNADGLPAGQYTIRQYLPAAYSAPMALCGVGPTGGASPNPNEVVTVDGSYEFTLGAGESIACSWFHVTQGEATIEITNLFCPADVDVSSPDVIALGQACRNVQSANFALYNAETDDLGYGNTDPATGEILFEHLPVGQIIVAQGFIDGYRAKPVVFCDRYSADGQRTGYHLQTVYTDDPTRGANSHVIDTTLDDLDILDCSWFNVPDPEASRLTIYKYVCPEDAAVDYADLGKDDLGNRCPAYEGTEATFDLRSQTTGETETKHTDTDPNGGGTYGAYWDTVAAGPVTVTEHPWEGYGTPRVFCGIAGVGGIAFIDVVVAGTSADFYVPSGAAVLCFWFNIPDDDGSVIIFKYFCPEGTGDEIDPADHKALSQSCEPYSGGEVEFDLYHAGTGKTETRATDEPKSNAAHWDGLPPGDLTITEHEVEGYGTPIVFCGPGRVEQEPDLARYDVEGTSVAVRLEPRVVLYCFWFNIPEKDGSVTVVKYDCPVGTGSGLGGFDRYDERCNEAAEGVSFKLDGERTGNPGSQETGADGVAIWGAREADRYFLTEEVPAGYGTPVVFCDTYYPLDEQPPTFDPFAVDGNARIEFGLSEGQAILCVWFNIPAYDDDDPGMVTVVKYWCDGVVVSETACERYGGGQAFVLRPVGGGQAIELTTGGNGMETVAVPAGRWNLDEVGREWCKASSAGIDQNGDLVVADGRETVVTVYNCGDRPDPVPPTKLPNTGSGPVAPPSSGIAGGAATLGLLLVAGSLLAVAGRRTRTPFPLPPGP